MWYFQNQRNNSQEREQHQVTFAEDTARPMEQAMQQPQQFQQVPPTTQRVAEPNGNSIEESIEKAMQDVTIETAVISDYNAQRRY